MTDFTIQIAGSVAAVSALFASTRTCCAAYLTDAAPDFSVCITPADIAAEREKSLREDAVEGLPPREYSDAYLETTAVLRKISAHLLLRDTLLFHGSVVAVDGAAYLFTAKSGTGKSTHTRLWRELLGARATMVNDDKPFLRVLPDAVLACGSPWNGKHRLGTNISVPLRAICILERGAQNEIEEIPARDAVPMLLQQSSRPADTRRMPHYLALLDALSRSVRFYRLRCNMDISAARLSYETMRPRLDKTI